MMLTTKGLEALVCEGTDSPGIECFLLGPLEADPGTPGHRAGSLRPRYKSPTARKAPSVVAFLQHGDAAWARILPQPLASPVTWAHVTSPLWAPVCLL